MDTNVEDDQTTTPSPQLSPQPDSSQQYTAVPMTNLLNAFMPSGLFYYNALDRSISNTGCLVSFYYDYVFYRNSWT